MQNDAYLLIAEVVGLSSVRRKSDIGKHAVTQCIRRRSANRSERIEILHFFGKHECRARFAVEIRTAERIKRRRGVARSGGTPGGRFLRQIFHQRLVCVTADREGEVQLFGARFCAEIRVGKRAEERFKGLRIEQSEKLRGFGRGARRLICGNGFPVRVYGFVCRQKMIYDGGTHRLAVRADDFGNILRCQSVIHFQELRGLLFGDFVFFYQVKDPFFKIGKIFLRCVRQLLHKKSVLAQPVERFSDLFLRLQSGME